MHNGETDDLSILHLREISQQEFCDHIEDEDFFLAYGNLLIINCDNGKKVAAIAWPLAERMLRLTGRGEEANEAEEAAKHNAKMRESVSTEKKHEK